MKSVPLEETELTVPDLAKLAKKDVVILTRKGKPVAGVRDLSGADWESVALANNEEFVALIEESRRSHRRQGGSNLAAIRKELGVPRKSAGGKKTGKPS